MGEGLVTQKCPGLQDFTLTKDEYEKLTGGEWNVLDFEPRPLSNQSQDKTGKSDTAGMARRV